MTRLKGMATTIVIAALVLAGCSTGSAPEAARGQRTDAERTSVISDMQATHTWELLNGTPDATPTETPAP